jgi:hypothetical protein
MDCLEGALVASLLLLPGKEDLTRIGKVSIFFCVVVGK